MTTVTVLPVATYAANAYALAPTAVADAVTSFEIEVQRCTTADPSIWASAAATIFFDIQASIDNGVTWSQLYNAGGPGGIAQDKFGNDVPAMYIQCQMPEGQGRKVKGTVTLSASIKTGATVTVI